MTATGHPSQRLVRGPSPPPGQASAMPPPPPVPPQALGADNKGYQMYSRFIDSGSGPASSLSSSAISYGQAVEGRAGIGSRPLRDAHVDTQAGSQGWGTDRADDTRGGISWKERKEVSRRRRWEDLQ